ncbi:hypothetical protein ACIBP4_17720 [Micromonospora maritima]|uniref:Uncharacterized protein n=1 Tax=Micromonospora maritima TaxID=986711 RepID=A0ABW7ZPX4_9ACTN
MGRRDGSTRRCTGTEIQAAEWEAAKRRILAMAESDQSGMRDSDPAAQSSVNDASRPVREDR